MWTNGQFYLDPVARKENLLTLRRNSHNLSVWEIHDMMLNNYSIPFFATVIYILFVYFGRRYMEKREALSLQYPLASWNAILAVFSIIGTYQTVPLYVGEWINGRGLTWELCHADLEATSTWTGYFIMSKIPELLDTVFIVLRKKELKFLQYYHHIITMWFCWLAGSHFVENGGAFAAMNFSIHAIMYTYFTCASLHIRWPEWARRSVTIAQISQMFFGTAFVIISAIACPNDIFMVYFGFIMYTSFFVLFAQLFYDMMDKDTSKSRDATKKID